MPGQTLYLQHYRLPRARDGPEIKVSLVEEPGQHGPLGAKGVGEAVMGHVRAAVAIAIFDATGIRLGQLPATPERLRGLMTSHQPMQQGTRALTCPCIDSHETWRGR